MISPVLSRVIEERVLLKTSFQNLIIQAATFSEHIEREVSETAGGDDISLYVWEVLQTGALKILLGSIVHKSNYVAVLVNGY
jgi:hypothetical protein